MERTVPAKYQAKVKNALITALGDVKLTEKVY